MRKLFVLFLMSMFLSACSVSGVESVPQDKTFTYENDSITPDKNQAPFPSFGEYWIIDNGCNFSSETLIWSNEILDQLNKDGIAEVAIVCQTDVKSLGSLNDEKVWLTKWARWARIGDVENGRGVVWLIRPDVDPSINRVTIEISRDLVWYTAIDYGPALEEAANYANYENFDGALEAITRGTDVVLRDLWETRNGE